METIRIFDEYKGNVTKYSPEERHEKRCNLDIIVYNILRNKYGNLLETFWKSYTIPKRSDKCIVIVERRIHPNLDFILKNAVYFARGWSVVIVCSDVNIEYCKEISEHNKENITFLQLFKGNPSRKDSILEYNLLLTSSKFYSILPSENLLFMQTDTYLRKKLPDSILEYDFIGSPYAWDTKNAGGGLTFRKKSVMIDICNKKPYNNVIVDEDSFISNAINEFNYKMPDPNNIIYFSESWTMNTTYGFHQWWTFFDTDFIHSNDLFKYYMSFDL